MTPSDQTDVPTDAVFQYLTGQMNPDQPPLIETFVREGNATVSALHPMLDLAYGEHPRERFDLFTAPNATGTLLYLHAGYWQGRDKAQFRFLAPAFVRAGFNVAFANYPLCPDVTIAALTESVRHLVPAVTKAATGGDSLVVIGHSAGGHLAVELALTDWQCKGFRLNPVGAIIGLSGVYDLEPLIETPLNDKLQLDVSRARAASPLHRVKNAMPPAIFAVGGKETPAFHAQTRSMCNAWANAGNEAILLTADDADHFTLLRHLENPADNLFAATVACARRARLSD